MRENPPLKRPKPAPLKDVVPLNDIDDPFISLSDAQLMDKSRALDEELIVRLMAEDFERGLYSVGRVREKYLGNEQYKPYPWMDEEKLGELTARATDKMTNDNPLDVRFEISGFLASNMGLQSTLYKMMDRATSDRLRNDIIRSIAALKDKRVEFIRTIAKELAEQDKDPAKQGMLPPGAIPVTDLLKQGAAINAHTDIPDEYDGILESGDLASERRDRATTRKVEREQDTIRSASFLP